MKSISVIGVGRVGGALALALSKKNYRVEHLFTRNAENAKNISKHISPKPQILGSESLEKVSAEIIFITTQDSEVEHIAEKLSRKSFKKETFIFHTSGSISSDVLADLSSENCKVGSIHPLISVSDSFLGVQRFHNAFFCVEGNEAAVLIAKKIVDDLGGRSFSINTEYKTLYHASAVTACGHLVALVDVATEMLKKCGLDAETAKEVLMPLVKSTVENLEQQTNSEALTGTFARGDVKTLENHIESLSENVDEEILSLYLQLGERSIHLAKEQGMTKSNLQEMVEKISLAKKNLRC